MNALEPDWDAGTENAYDNRRGVSTGLCARPWCNDQALPDEEFCADCVGDIENEIAERMPVEWNAADDAHLVLKLHGRPLGLA